MKTARGISLIELMIGMAVGLMVALSVLSTVSLINQQRRDTVSGNDAKESAQLALSLIDDAGRQAGAGLFYNGALLCPRINLYANGAVRVNGANFMPVRIVDGGTTGSDSITFAHAGIAAGAAGGGNSLSVLVGPMADSTAEMLVNAAGSLQVGDQAIIGNGTDPCTLFQVTGFSAASTSCNDVSSTCIGIQHAVDPTTAPVNAPTGSFATEPAYAAGAAVSRMGGFVMTRYAVMCNSLVSSSGLGDPPSCTDAPLAFTNALPLVGNVVQIRAQYGIAATAGSDIVTNWVDATGGWAAPALGDIPRIKAIRVAVVARGQEAAGSAVSQGCTNAAGVVNTGPCTFADAEAPVVDLSALAMPAGKTWQHYRYRVHQSVIPLRNVAWNY